MDLKHSELDTLYEGSDPEKYSKFSAKNINKPYTQLLENDAALLAEAEKVKLLTTANKNQNVDNDRDLSATLPKVSALEGNVPPKPTRNNLNITSPLNANGFLIGGLTRGPVGYSGSGTCVVSAVSAYTKGFQGPYTDSKPSSASATSKDSATATSQFYYGAWDSGPRTGKGGLTGGEQSTTRAYRPPSTSSSVSAFQEEADKEGALLKLSKPSGTASPFLNACMVKMKYFCNTSEVRLRAYVWIDSGPKHFKFGAMRAQGTISVANLKEWTPVDVIIETDGSTSNYWRIILDTSEAQDIYIAMLGIYTLGGSGNTTSSVNVE